MLQRFVRLAALALACALGATSASADYPEQPVRLVVPFPQGGATDIMARLLAERLRDELGQPVLVDNKPGAGTMIASDLVARSPADGYTVLLAATPFVIAPSLYAKVGYDPLKDFTPIGQVASIVHVLVVHPSVPAHSVQELVAWLKATPGKASYGSVGAGTLTHIKAEDFKRRAGVDMVHVPYKGSAPAAIDLVGGQIQLMFDSYPSARPFIRDGKVRALAVASLQRSPVAPDLPTVAQAGLPGFDVAPWLGLVVPAGTPEQTVARLERALAAATAHAELRQRFLELGLDVAAPSRAAFGRLLREDRAGYATIVRQANIKVD